jgi:hypothetical protein
MTWKKNKNYDTVTLRTGIMAGSPCPIEVMKSIVNDEDGWMHTGDLAIKMGDGPDFSPFLLNNAVGFMRNPWFRLPAFFSAIIWHSPSSSHPIVHREMVNFGSRHKAAGNIP